MSIEKIQIKSKIYFRFPSIILTSIQQRQRLRHRLHQHQQNSNLKFMIKKSHLCSYVKLENATPIVATSVIILITDYMFLT
ncbi:hypothetical protein CVS40_10738 [Lucilia cuprina]|nr:hypothetical protein CVS40_10738 [Lucilia cuprina]